MTEQQQKHSCRLRKLFPKKPQKTVPRPQNRCQTLIFNLVTKPYYEVVMVMVVFLNMLLLMVETNSQSSEKEEILHWFHFILIIIFLVECILKIIAFRKHYFKDGWNIVDFVVLIMSLIGLFINDLIEKYFLPIYSTPGFSLFRLARLGRILNIIPCARGLRKMLIAFVMSLPALVNIGFVLFLIMVTYSIFGMFNFAYVKKVAEIDDVFNFETFWNSLTCMFLTGTSTSWGGLLIPIISTPPDCDPYADNPGLAPLGDCGSPVLGVVFFTSYVVLSFLLVLHLYITVVLAMFNTEDPETLSDDDLKKFYNAWKTFDPDASQFIPYSKLSDFCDSLQEPLRIPKPNTIKLVHMDLPLHPGDKVHCVDVFLSLAKQVLDDAEEVDSLKAKMEEKLRGNQAKVSNEPISSTLQRKQEEVAARVIQRAYRKGFLQHREAKETTHKSVNGMSGSSQKGGASE